MTRINLLPWREARRTQRQRELIAMLAVVALLAVGLVALVYSDVSQRIEFQQERNNYLRGEIARLKKAAEELQALQQTRNRLVERLNVIQKLQTSRPGMVRMLDELVRLIPQDIYLTTFKTAENQITLIGVARSDVIISSLMRSIRDAKMFGEPVLQVVQTQTINNVQVRTFELLIPLKLEGDAADTAGGKS
ncbi:MAG TPA: PilN domain-containing protein [Candidatus Competibacteraceae bacterium]|nr:MAG: pilus assembly protein PilN [Candidatus Competibacteraceae bacterium]HNW78182.1 PilN domain-containing protein [Candidatus Competibacteraceae bacterium]HQC72904.1 PilN domain-containing protein [Candidatus Competibacteraceae bacterium]